VWAGSGGGVVLGVFGEALLEDGECFVGAEVPSVRMPELRVEPVPSVEALPFDFYVIPSALERGTEEAVLEEELFLRARGGPTGETHVKLLVL
jgi:hypothetical protein